MSGYRRRIAYEDTSIVVLDSQMAGRIIVLFDSNDSPLHKVVEPDASELISGIAHLNLDVLGFTRRLQRLVYQRAVADGAIVNPERSTHVCDA